MGAGASPGGERAMGPVRPARAEGVVRLMCSPRLSEALGVLAARSPVLASQVALVALCGAREGPGEVVTLRGLRRALPALRPGLLVRAADQLVELGLWARHDDGYVSLDRDDQAPDQRASQKAARDDLDRLARRRATFRASSKRYRAAKAATQIATPPAPVEGGLLNQGLLTPPETPRETCNTQQVLPGFANGSAETVNTVNTRVNTRQHRRASKSPKEKKPREKSPKDLRLELVRARYVAAYLARFGVEPGLPAWSLVQRVETWVSRHAQKVGKDFEALVDLVIAGYFKDDWALDAECPFKPLSDNPARFYRAGAGLSEPKRIRRRGVTPAPPAPPGAFDGYDIDENLKQMEAAALAIEERNKELEELARIARAEEDEKWIKEHREKEERQRAARRAWNERRATLNIR